MTEDHPWGERAFKIKGKVFLFLSRHEDGLNVTVKLPQSNTYALTRPFAKPTGYGLGKSGWVAAQPTVAQIDIAMFKAWIDESYRAQAPKKLLAQLAGAPKKPAPATKRRK